MRIIEWSSDVCSSDLPYGVSACSISPCDLAWRGNGIGAARRLMDVPFISHNNLEFQMHVIDPNNVEPTINQASAEHRDGRQVHRRILSRSEEHTSELQSLMRISYAVFCLKKKTKLSK